MFRYLGLCLAFFILLTACDQHQDNNNKQKIKFLNVSYDVSRDFYKDYNQYFIQNFENKHPELQLSINQSHGGSGKQAFAVGNGLKADVVTLNQVNDINYLVQKKLISPQWQQFFPDNSIPFSTVTVFLVRKGNPKNIHTWEDLINKPIAIVAPNPKTSGTARYVFLSAYIQAYLKNQNSDAAAQEYITQLYRKIPVLDSGGRSASNSFIQRQIGDVLITLENEAYIAIRHLPKGDYEIIHPDISVKAVQPVAVVEENTKKNHTEEIAQDYIQQLWSEQGQEIAAHNYLRPTNPAILKKYKAQFPEIKVIDATDLWNDWDTIQQKFFADGGIFDQIYSER
ncbi:MAG: sulfate ABC transporter substrate-binding protein [Neisseriaceae bacterium]|nr:sulfate ABC transporter substrate-binding protein [Neisseriaceae bacterium]